MKFRVSLVVTFEAFSVNSASLAVFFLVPDRGRFFYNTVYIS